MIGSNFCVYETPCGWCSKWNKKCDKTIPSIEKDKKNNNWNFVLPFDEGGIPDESFFTYIHP